MLRNLPQRFRPVAGLQNVKSAELERPHDQAANAFVVLDDEDGFRTSHAARAGFLAGPGRGGLASIRGR